MDKLKMTSTGAVPGNVAKIATLFPNCVTERLNKDGLPEAVVDFDKLREELSTELVEGAAERYQFTWPDKRAANHLANTPTTMTLRPCEEESVGKDGTPGVFDSENLYIEGDNLDVLKVLRETYLGQVKMIYIDPPYNTGSDFVYNDDFTSSYDEFAESCKVYDEDGNLTFDPKANNESNGRFHTDWLNMIYPRLKIARDLLAEDGVIFIAIDDNEIHNLRKVCDEIFGCENLVAQFIWEQGRKSMAAQVAVNHEYCVVYSKNRALQINYDRTHSNHNWQTLKIGLDKIYAEVDRLKSVYGNDVDKIEKGLAQFYRNLPEGDPAKAHAHYKKYDPINGVYFQGDISQGTGNGGRFPIIHPITGKPCKQPSGGWRFSESKLPILLKENRISFGPDETTIPCLKRFLKETEYEVCASVFYKDGRGASKRLDNLLGKGVFDYPKDEDIVKNFISWVTSYENSDSLVLDFFSGSATTAHAVMKLNAEDGGHRKFIMVQLPEVTDEKSEARKAGYNTICEIGKERIRRAGRKIKEEAGLHGQDLDIGFRVLKLAVSNMEDVFYAPDKISEDSLFVDNVKADRTSEDLLFQVMLELGIELSSPIEKKKINGKEVFSVRDGFLMATFDENVDEATITEIAQSEPVYFVMRDASAANDNVLDNFEQLFRHYSPDTIRRIL